MLTQTKDAPEPAGLPDPGRAGGDRRDRHRGPASPSRSRRRTGARSAARLGPATDDVARLLFSDFVLPFEVVSVLLLAAVIGGVFLAKRETGRAVVSDSLDAYLILSGILFAIGSFGFLARRNAISMLMSIELMLNAVNLSIVAFGAFIPQRCQGAWRRSSR